MTTGQWTQPGGTPQAGTGPQQGTGPQPAAGAGTGPQQAPAPQDTASQSGSTGAQSGARPQDTGQHPQPGTGPQPQPGTGPYPQQGTAQFAPPGGQQFPPPGGQQFPPPGGQQFGQQGSPYGGPSGPYGQPTGPQQWGTPPGGTAQMPVPEFGPQGPPPPKKSPLPWVLGGGAVVILLVVALVIGLSIVNRDTTPTAVGTPLPSETVEPSDPQITPPLEDTPTPDPSTTDFPAELPEPKGNVIEDPRTGLSFAFPGDPWVVPKWSDLNGPADPRFPQWSSGYQAVSQKDYDGKKNDWVGTVTACRLPEAFDYSGPENLRDVTKLVLNAYEKGFYSPPHKRRIVKDAAIEVSGKQAWLLRFEMDFSADAKKAGWKFRKEEGMFVLVDRGAGERPALLYASVPDNLDTSVIDRVLDSLKAS
ncbi:hypothetical protein [Sphaerisporangium perillae]|uniref:hypothetical protein n=1 Tax=Sphaerisporangium perillae TaxID=2935860 RepID=UPI00200F5C3C|nr:hypothetical protein [Sphaerisporangium perillae]